MFEIAIAVMALTSPVWVVVGVISFIKCQDEKKRTWAGIKVGKEFAKHLNDEFIRGKLPDGSEIVVGYQKEGF